MASSTKIPKDKPYSGSPRLVPRPTAASSARAARNATNRNLIQAPMQRQSPTRTSSSPAPSKTKSSAQRKIESKTDMRVNPENDQVIPEINDQLPQTVDSYIIFDNNADKDTLDTMDTLDNGDIDETHLQEIQENEVFEIKEEELMEIHDVQDRRKIGNILSGSPRSRPLTPSPSSRPQTPRSLPTSRPQTPRPLSRPTTPQLSRPTTPLHPIQCHGTPVSRPNTPRSPTRPTTPSSVKVSLPVCNVKDQDDIKTVFATKQKQFHRMKKELDMKQQAVLEVFDNLQSLRERMSREGISGCGEGHLQELVVFNVADWTSEEVSQLCRDAVASSATEGAIELINTTVPIDECALEELDSKVLSVPCRFADLCLQAFTARQELIDWIKGLLENNIIKEENGDGECLERIARYNAQGLELCEALREIKSRADDAVETVTRLSRRACRERCALIAVGESLVREIARLRQDIETRTLVVSDVRVTEAEAIKAREEAQRESQIEKSSRNNKEKLATTESQLRQARNRVSKMDRQLREAEATIASLTSSVKTLEDQSRQKEVQLEARARKLKESLKTGEVTSGHLSQQRDLLQSQVSDLKKQIETLTTGHKAAIEELSNHLKATQTTYEEQHKILERQKESKIKTESELAESLAIIKDLKAKITEFELNKQNPELPTEREMDLWAELQATKDTLRLTEDEVTSCKREKVRFLETLTKISESESKVGIQQKLAAELLSKEELFGKMQTQTRELTKNIKLNEQKVMQYEQYVRDLQAHNRAVANCQKSPNGISYEDLQQEIMSLKMKLLEADHRNEELSEKLVQKEQQIEQQDKTSRAQARVIKVREELINMLKNKETEQSRELTALQQDLEHRMKIVDEVNKQIAAKAEEIQELFSTLENKQQQIHRLEKIVLALEEQQRRAQAQRTRHEEKIAALEHELAAGGNRKERKFLFF